jgi:membrane associated rhomboid family serine protease
VWFEPSSTVPMVGASGAIAGVMGAYLLLFPKAKVDILIIFVVFFRIFPIPAWILLMLWFAMQFIGGIGADPDQGGSAYWAHAGGFVAGLLGAVPLWLRRGGVAFWQRTHGHPPHPEASYPKINSSSIPKVKRR